MPDDNKSGRGDNMVDDKKREGNQGGKASHQKTGSQDSDSRSSSDQGDQNSGNNKDQDR